MNKKLMAVAVAGAFAAPAVVLAQASNVQIYGNITYEYGYVTKMGNYPAGAPGFGQGRDKTDVAQTPGGSSIGFRGSEKLGGGLTAWFQCESSADVRGIGQEGLCGRNSAIGFKGNWGNLHFGRWDTPFKRAFVGIVGAKGTGLLGSDFTVTGAGGAGTGTQAGTGDQDREVWKRREAALTYYESPKFSGFQVLAAFSPGNDATNKTAGEANAKARIYSISGVYKGGPLAIGLGYEQHQDFTDGVAGGDDEGYVISAAYTFANKIKVGLNYLDTKYDFGTVDSKKKTIFAGVDWKIAGPHSAHFGYTWVDDTKGSNTTITFKDLSPNCAGCSTGADWYSIAYQYTFSKRTNVRFGWVGLKNDEHASYTLGGLSDAGASGQKQSAIVMFLQHRF